MGRFTDYVADGFYNMEGGMNSGLSPSIIEPNQCALSVNTTFRGGLARSRPKFRRIAVDFGSASDSQTWYQTNPISGSSSYQPINGNGLVVCCSGGRFFSFRVTGTSATASEFTPTDQRNDRYQPITWFAQAANFLVANNGLDKPVIFDGASGRRSNIIANNEVPVGKQMAYINSRLWVVLPDARELVAGDLAYSTPTSAVTFTEVLQSATQGGQPLGIPLEIGGIKGLAVTFQLGTGTGQGVLLVATDRAIASINPIVQRNLWPQTQLQSIALVGNGFTSNGLAVVNGDVWGRSLDGYRSFISAQRIFNPLFGGWGNTPQSREVEQLLQYDDRSLLEYASLTYFDNRILMTVGPKTIGNGLSAYHSGIIAVNCDNISTLNTKSAPAYDGLWTGVQPYGFTQANIDGQQRCFMFCYFPETGTNELWEVTTEYGNDNDETRITSFIDSRSFDFKTKNSSKQLESCELFVDQIVGQVDFDLKYKPNQHPCFQDWASWSECAGGTDCDSVGPIGGVCKQPVFTEMQYRPRMVIGQPPVVCDPVLKTIMSRGYEFQTRLTWTGQARIRSQMLFASPRQENTSLIPSIAGGSS